MNNASAPRSRGPRNDRRNWAGEQSRGRRGDPGVMDVMKMIGAFTNCLESFTRRFESPNSRTQSYNPIAPEFVLDLCMCAEFVFVFVLGLCRGCGLIVLWPVD